MAPVPLLFTVLPPQRYVIFLCDLHNRIVLVIFVVIYKVRYNLSGIIGSEVTVVFNAVEATFFFSSHQSDISSIRTTHRII